MPTAQSETIYCGPEVKRFDALKAGDKVTFRYQESVVYEIAKPGAAPTVAEAGGVTRTAGTKPGGTISQTAGRRRDDQRDRPQGPVGDRHHEGRPEDGIQGARTSTNLTGVKVGDQVQITYTQALAISVEAAAK